MNDFYIVDNVLLKYKGFDETVVIPDGVKVIGRQAFCFKSGIKKVVIPENVLNAQNMSDVADKMNKPLNELRFISIKEVE